jgi:universal stress protein E
MRRFRVRRILVAIKALQARSHPAVTKAAQIARAYGAELELFHGLDVPLYLDSDAVVGKHPQALQQELAERARARLDAIAQPLRGRGLKVRVAVQPDSPAFEAIIRRALRIHADLIVTSYHTGPHRRAWLLQLTDWELVRLSTVPVLLIKSAQAYRRPVLLAAVDPTHAFAKPLHLDRQILDVAQSLSDALRGALHAVHGYPPVPVEILAPGAKATAVITPQRLQQAQQRAARDARAHLERLLRRRAIAASNQHIVAGHPIDVIAATARSSHSAVVVMGAISRSGLKRLLIGNTAERILDAIRCDVLVVKPSSFRNRVRRASRPQYGPPAAVPL